MAWIEPIVDRTQADVLYAMLNQGVNQDLKGAYNVSDINRVINNIDYLHNLLGIYDYHFNVTPQSNIVMSDLPFVNSTMDIIRNNIVNIVNSFYKLNNPTINYGDTFDFNDANALEINLMNTNILLESLISNLKYSGTFYSGEEIIL